MSRLFGVPLDFSSSALATPPNIMSSQDGCWPKPEPVVNAAVDDPISKLRHDIDLAQRNQVQFEKIFGYFNVDAYASTVHSEGGGEGGYVTQHPRNDKNELGSLVEAMRRLQESHLRVTRRIYGLQAARIQAESMGRNSGEIRFSAGELVVAVVRSVRNNQVWVDLLISRNNGTSIASLEAFSLGLSSMVWRQHSIAPSGTPLETLRAYLAYRESMAREGIIVNSVLIDGSSINGFRQSAKCFCNEAFTIDYAAHGPVHCSLHQVATSVVVRLREIVTPNAMLGQPLMLRDVPPIHHSIFKSGGETDRASLNQWPSHPHTAPTPKKKQDEKQKAKAKADAKSGVSKTFSCRICGSIRHGFRKCDTFSDVASKRKFLVQNKKCLMCLEIGCDGGNMCAKARNPLCNLCKSRPPKERMHAAFLCLHPEPRSGDRMDTSSGRTESLQKEAQGPIIGKDEKSKKVNHKKTINGGNVEWSRKRARTSSEIEGAPLGEGTSASRLDGKARERDARKPEKKLPAKYSKSSQSKGKDADGASTS